MPDEQTPTTPETPAETPPAGEAPPTPNDETPPAGETPPEKPALSLEDALAEVAKTRAEAANYRTRAKTAEEALKGAKTIEEVNAVIQQMTEEREAAERALLVENVALQHNLPEALAKRLQGNTREELEADAKALASIVPSTEVETETPPRLRGGLTPDEGASDDSLSPGELAKKYAPRR